MGSFTNKHNHKLISVIVETMKFIVTPIIETMLSILLCFNTDIKMKYSQPMFMISRMLYLYALIKLIFAK